MQIFLNEIRRFGNERESKMQDNIMEPDILGVDSDIPVEEERYKKLEPIKTEVEEVEEEKAAKWLETYGDMVTLLLTFFVLLFAFSTIDKQKFQKIAISLRETLRRGGLEVSEEDEAVSLKEKDVVVEISGHILFERGRADLTGRGKEFLNELYLKVIDYFENDITVVGHTDDTPVKPGGHFDDNWHLSAMRALKVVQYYIDEKGVPGKRFTIKEHADKEINKLKERKGGNITEKDREKARRVDIIFHLK